MRDQHRFLICVVSLCTMMMVMRRQRNDKPEQFRIEFRQLSSAMQQKYCSSVKSHQFSAAEEQQYRRQSVNGDNKVAQYLKSNNHEQLKKEYLGDFSIWLCLSIVCLGGLVYGSAHVLIGFKPWCLYRNRDYGQKPLQRSELVYPVVALMVFNCLTIGVCVSGVIYADRIPQYVKQLQCQMISSVDSVLTGQPSNGQQQFLGIANINAKLDYINTDLQSQLDIIKSKLTSTAWVQSSGDALKSTSSQIYLDHRNVQILIPNPNQIGNTNTATSRQSSYYMKYLLGPSGNSDTAMSRIEKEVLTVSRMVADLCGNLQTAVNQVSTKLQTNALPTSLITGKQINSELQSKLEILNASIQTQLKDTDSYQALVLVALVLMVIILIMAAFSLLICLYIFLSTSTSSTRQQKLKRVFHSIWVGFNVLTVLCLLVTGGLWSLSGAVYDGCSAFDYVLLNKNNFQQYPLLLDPVVSNRLQICLWKQGGKYQSSLGLESDLNQVAEMTNNLDNFINLNTASSSTYLNLPLKASTTFTQELSTVGKYQAGNKQALNSDYHTMTDDNPVVSLSKLNLLSDASLPGATGCSVSKDFYVFSLQDCPQGYSVFSNQTSTISYNYGQPTCIQIQQMYKNNFQTRHSAYLTQCSIQYQTMYQYYYVLYNFDSSNRQAFYSLSTALTSLSTNTDTYIANILTQYNSLNQIYPQVQSFVNFFNLFITQLDCSFLEADINRALNSLCIGIGSNLYKTMSLITMSAFSLLISTILAYVFATRFDKYKPIKLNHNKNIYQRRSQRLSMSHVSQTKYLDEISNDLVKNNNNDPELNNLNNLELTNFQSKPNTEFLIRNISTNELKSNNTENIKEEEQQPEFDSLKEKGTN